MERNTKLLIVDDNQAIHDDFYKILTSARHSGSELELNQFEEALFSEKVTARPSQIKPYEIDSAFQGEQAFNMVKEAERNGAPYGLIFMDCRMPPGWNGIETSLKIWEFFPYTEIVLVTAYSDYTWEEVLAHVGETDRLMFLKKPFDSFSVKQMALALTQKWTINHMARMYIEDLEKELTQRCDQVNTILETLKSVSHRNREAQPIKTNSC